MRKALNTKSLRHRCKDDFQEGTRNPGKNHLCYKNSQIAWPFLFTTYNAAMPNASFQLRDMLIHKKIQTVGMIVFVDAKRQRYRVCVDEDMPLEDWGFHEVELYQKNSA